MIVTEVKDQLLDILKTRWGELQESSIYIQIKEKYDDMSSGAQKLVVLACIAIIVLFLVLPPWSWIGSSSTFIESFESKKALIRSLLQLKRDIAQAPAVANGISSSALKKQVETSIRAIGLNADQIKGVAEISLSNDGSSTLVADSVLQNGVQITVSKINLEQFVDLSYRIQKMNLTAKLLSVDMKANNEDNHYYDVIYQLISFAVPQVEVEIEGDGK